MNILELLSTENRELLERFARIHKSPVELVASRILGQALGECDHRLGIDGKCPSCGEYLFSSQSQADIISGTWYCNGCFEHLEEIDAEAEKANP